MGEISKRDTIVVRLIANTLKRRRPNSIIEIADDIKWLEKELGSLKNVSKAVGLSGQMLRKFLSVYELCPNVKKLVAERKLDSVTIVHLMKDFDGKDQQIIAAKVMAGELSVDHMKAMVPLSKKIKNVDIEQLISRVRKSKNYKVYLARFILVNSHSNLQEIRKPFENVVGKDQIISLTSKGNVGTIELTFLGQKRLREAAKTRNITLKGFVDNLISK